MNLLTNNLNGVAIMTNEFDTALSSYLRGCQQIVSGHRAAHFPNLVEPTLEIKMGRRYAKVIRFEDHDGERFHTSVHAFVDTTNGDVLMPAGWAKPAKHARGNIYDVDNGLKYMGPHGPAYLR